jgi:transaldolase / glucose-6-phosphate isomerase
MAETAAQPALNPFRISLNAPALGALATEVAAEIKSWSSSDRIQKFWHGDPAVWSGADESKWVGWLGIVESELAQVEVLEQFAAEIRAAGFRYAVTLGMGGSSLCPDVLRRTFGTQLGAPELLVVDSVVPAQIRAVLRQLDLRSTVFLVASKSGSTIEPNTLKQFFFDEVAKAVGPERASRHFVAITDPGTKMEQIARSEQFRAILYGRPDIGGRYSALSKFGLVPAAAMGLDVRKFLTSAHVMTQACRQQEENPGVALGCVMGVLAKQGRDKVTVVASPGIGLLGAWVEQLIAESTGKKGIGIVPVDGEITGPASLYGADRLFVYARLVTAPSATQEAAIAALEAAGQPVVVIDVQSEYDLGQEFFRWEIATAIAGAILNINPFDQPDVEAAKIAARKLTSEYETSGRLPEARVLASGMGISLYAGEKYAAQLTRDQSDVTSMLSRHLASIHAGDYFAINAYVDMSEQNIATLQALRHSVRAAKKCATTLGFGPRFLHSTGQLHKGGANNGVFLQITADDAYDLTIPGQKFSFGVLKTAQAQGDFEVLVERGRRVLRVHLGSDVEQGLEWLGQTIAAVL